MLVAIELITHILFKLLTLEEKLGEFFEHIVSGEYVNSFLGAANEIVEVTVWPSEDVSNEIISFRVVAFFLDVEEVGEVCGLVIKVDYEDVEALTSMGFSEIGCPRGLVDTSRL
ncbi:hypothetical protein GCM10009037_29410 [Halarchaeum grantii]|uniref:Uncharacterized protein n=1 Tax=Halarchaeum grantii TaxID=1193105 RepID=A0A830FDH5_9EURY|nr:hypothetical protein GCM10009037_29410 [Halarchaeum grantii]